MLPGNPFMYTRMDDYFNKQYHIEQTFEKIFEVFTILAIFIACLGLFGLSSFESTQRIKEVGIRKVHGARIFNILTLFSKDFIKLNLISFLIAVPVIYFIMNYWLQNFAYRIGINIMFFIIPTVIILVLSLFTVNLQVFKIASTNPADSLRYE
jgi:putative ABC transport system permease protein